MADEPRNLKECFRTSELRRQGLDHFGDSNSESFQHELAHILSLYEACLVLADDISLFSVNESVEDIASTDLKFLLIHFYLAELTLRVTLSNRKLNLLRARAEYERFLRQLDQYDVLSPEDAKVYERYREDVESFSTASIKDAGMRRQQKIARFRQEAALKTKLRALEQDPGLSRQDDSIIRELYLAHINLNIHHSFQSLESIAQELQMIGQAPPSPPPDSTLSSEDPRGAGRNTSDAYSDRLDKPLSQLLGASRGGPILSSQGHLLRPFTLLDSRQRIQQGVFRPDHNLPTMTIDEYLEEEKRRGGMIGGGGEQSRSKPAVDEDDNVRADEETMKARQWDEYVEENPRGSGNTMNLG